MSMIRFTKMHGLGNDFVVIDNVTQQANISSEVVKKISNRNLGIGCDQLLLLEQPNEDHIDFIYRIFNADGTEVNQCGNGARCIARFILDEGLSNKHKITLKTKSGNIHLSFENNDNISVNMGMPKFAPNLIPINLKANKNYLYNINLIDNNREVAALSMGNPHCIIPVAQISEVDINTIGNKLQDKNLFPEGVNVSFVQQLASNHIKLRVFERGVGETLCCGSACCASVVAGIRAKQLSNEVKVDMPGGHVIVSWQDEASEVILTGPAASVFKGEFALTD